MDGDGMAIALEFGVAAALGEQADFINDEELQAFVDRLNKLDIGGFIDDSLSGTIQLVCG